jgi:hypothetical protein
MIHFIRLCQLGVREPAPMEPQIQTGCEDYTRVKMPTTLAYCTKTKVLKTDLKTDLLG